MMRHNGFDSLLTLSYHSDKCQQHTLLVMAAATAMANLPRKGFNSLSQQDVAAMAELALPFGAAALGASAGTPQLPEPLLPWALLSVHLHGGVTPEM